MNPHNSRLKFKLVGLGEILWDLLPGGRQLGGAPANFAYHTHALGSESHVISRVGRDDLGKELIQKVESLGLGSEGIELDDINPTGTVSVEVGADGQPKFVIHENAAWDALAMVASARETMATADAICFGSLAQRSEVSRATIQNLIKLAPSSALRIFDINLRQHYFSESLIRESLELANILKVNDVELPRLKKILALPGEAREQILELAARYSLRAVAYTRGEKGSLIYARDRWSEHPGYPTKVVDTVGAGDSFTAALALGFLAGWELDRINEQANRVAAFVCTRPGATPELPAELKAAFFTASPQ